MSCNLFQPRKIHRVPLSPVGFILVILSLLITSAPTKAEEVHLTFTAWGGLSHQETYQELARVFSEQHPTITVEFEPDIGAYVDRMKTNILAGTGPDIYFTQEMQTVGFVRDGWLIPLNDYMARDPELIDQIHPSLFESFTWEGQIGSLPVVTFASMFYYNPYLFGEAGLPAPQMVTWDDLRTWGRALTRRDGEGRIVQYGHRIEYPEVNFHLYYLWQNGGGLIDESRTRSLLNTPETINAVEFIRDLIWADQIIPKPDEMGDFLLEFGNLGMFTHGSWMTGYYESLFEFDDFEVLPAPIGEYNVGMAYPNGFGISAASKHPDEAWEFLKFLSGTEGQQIIASAGLGIPVNRDPAVARAYLDVPTPRRRLAELEALTTARPPYVVPGTQEDIIAQTVNPAMFAVWNNEADPAPVLEELHRLVQQMIDDIHAR